MRKELNWKTLNGRINCHAIVDAKLKQQKSIPFIRAKKNDIRKILRFGLQTLHLILSLKL